MRRNLAGYSLAMWYRLLTVAILASAPAAQAKPHHERSSSKAVKFSDVATALGLGFVPPDGWKPIAAVDNDQLTYDAAYRAPDGRFELRIAVRDDRELDRNLALQATSPGFVGVRDPLLLWSALVQAAALNISNGTAGQIHPLPPEILATYGSATEGAVGDMEAAGRFAAGWPRCALVAIRRGSVNAFLLVMYRSPEDLQTDGPDVAFGSLRFTGDPVEP